MRQFLAGRAAGRPPFLTMATAYTARLAQRPVPELLADPGLFVRSFTESAAVLGLEAVVIEAPGPAAAAAVREGPETGCAVLREDLHRLRATLGDRVAIVALLPGPLTLRRELGADTAQEEPDASAGPGKLRPARGADQLDDLVAGLIRLQEYLGPAELDALGLLERAPVPDADVPGLAEAAAAFWNVARYYSLPSLLVAAEGTARLAAAGASAVAAWSGVDAAGLLAAGAAVAGQPPPADLLAAQPVVGTGSARRGRPPPPGVFYLTAGEIPPSWEVGTVRALVRQLTT